MRRQVARSQVGRTGDGFTLIELMICVTVAGLLSSALGLFYVHHRARARAVSVDQELEQTARLPMAHLRRDGRLAARLGRASPAGLVLEGPGRRKVTYRIQPKQGGLSREVAGTEHPRVRTFFPRVVGLNVRPASAALTVRLTLAAELAVITRRREATTTIWLGGAR